MQRVFRREIPNIVSPERVVNELFEADIEPLTRTWLRDREIEAKEIEINSKARLGQNPRQAKPNGPSQNRGDQKLLDGKRAVSFKTAETYLGISERQRQNLVKAGVLGVEGKGQNRKITTVSLIQYLPPENPK